MPRLLATQSRLAATLRTARLPQSATFRASAASASASASSSSSSSSSSSRTAHSPLLRSTTSTTPARPHPYTSTASSPSPILSQLARPRLSLSSARALPAGFGGLLATAGTPTPPSGARWTTYGQEYQPSQRVRKRKHGFLSRLKHRNGRKTLRRRLIKRRKFLSH